MAEEKVCVCGYTPKYKFDPEFIESKNYFEFDLGKQEKVFLIEPNKVKIFACPRCGTLKIEL